MAQIHIRAPLCIAAGAILPPVCSGLVAMRFFARRQQRSRYEADDWLTLPALALLIGMSAAILVGVAHKSVGYPTPPLGPGMSLLTASSYQQSTTRSIYWSIEIMQIPALAAVKMSFVFFYRRIFNKGSNKAFGRITVVVLALILMWGVGYFFSFLFICPGHPTAYWTTLIIEKNYCINTVILHNAYGVSDVLLDLIVILLPIPVIWRLQMSTGHKLGVVGVFGLGAFTILASIFRMVTYLQSTAVEFQAGTDTDILITGGIYWSVVETGVGLISACLPTVYGVFRIKALRSTIPGVGSIAPTKSRLSVKGSFWGSQIRQTTKIERCRNDSQASNIELASRVPQNTTKASAENEPWGTAPQDHILITKTFGATEQTTLGEMV